MNSNQYPNINRIIGWRVVESKKMAFFEGLEDGK